ncbi:hypothetical protein DTL70_04805 [Streptomyces diacarni]|uniref:Protein kinase domain-containing protein n=1 Tax=Streptomyces diacarni TaxID=2800381 RepID=A0A367FDI3_9ACTN|nr:serine/threonine-protein kinase [Streptomyces diacarni]RCG27650.1 hypothetical protein DTL70_04805 [Streptomyces diacarni]
MPPAEKARVSRELLAPDAPQRIGPYWLASLLGAGGQGVVYEAYDSAGGRCVVKVLRAEGAAQDFARDRFRKEVEAAQQVASFCTARVLAADPQGDPPYIVSEFINGPDLQAAVRRDGPLGGDELVRLATGIATALAAIHAASVVHRDLKPANVLLGPDGPRVIDFGIARTQEMSLTETGKVMGTPGYMAPEVLRGGRADERSDVFAWGAVVLFAASGQAPFHGEHLGEIVVRVTESEPDLTPVPERLRPLVGAALSKDPAYRPGSTDLLLGLLAGGAREAPATDLLAQGARVAALPYPFGHAPALLPDWGEMAEHVFRGLEPAAQEAAEEVLLRLVVPGEAPDGSQDGVRTASQQELLAGRPAHESAALQQALDAFTAQSVLIREPDGSVRPASAALHRAWPRLAAWTAGHRTVLRVLRRTGEAARAWEEDGRDLDHLQQGKVLRAALDQAATAHTALRPNRLEREYLAAARAHESRRHRQRRRLRGGIAVLLVMALAASIAAWRFQRANDEQQARATSRDVASVAEGMRGSDPELAALLDIAAWRVSPSDEARAGLYQSAWQGEKALFKDPTEEPSGFESGTARTLSRNGRVLVSRTTGTLDDTMGRFDVRTEKRLPLRTGGVPVEEFAVVAADGRYAATSDGTVRDLETGERVGKPLASGQSVAGLSTGGARMLVGTGDSALSVIDTRTGRTLRTVPEENAALTENGRHLFSCRTDQPPVLYDLTDGSSTKLRDRDADMCGGAASVSSSADGGKLATLGNGELSTWNTRTGKLLSTTTLESDDASGEPPADGALTMSADGRTVATMADGSIVVARSTDLNNPLPTHKAHTPGEAAAAMPTVSLLAIDSRARELHYVDGAAVHTLDLGALDLPREKTRSTISHYGPEAESLVTAHTVKGASRLRTWAVRGEAGHERQPDAPASTRALHDFPVRARALLGKSYGEGQLPSTLSPDGTTLAYPYDEVPSGSSFNVVLQELRDGKPEHRLVDLGGPKRGSAEALAFSSDGRTLAVSRRAGEGRSAWSIDIVDVAAGKKTRTVKGTGGHWLALGGTGDDLVLVTSSGDRVDPRTGKTHQRALGTADLTDVAFSPDGQTLAVSEPDGIALWNHEATQRSGRLPGPDEVSDGQATRLRFSPDGRSLAGVVGDKRLQLWDVPSRRKLGGLLPGVEAELLDVAFDERGALHLAGDRVRSHTMSLDPNELADSICRRVHRPKNLTRAEWKQNVPGVPYREVCGGDE